MSTPAYITLWSHFLFTAFVSLFVVLNPIGNAALLPTLVEGYPEAQKKRVVRNASIWVFIILSAFALAGPYLLAFFRISTSAFRIAGGLILFIVSIQMLQVRRPRMEHTAEEIQSAMEKDDISVVPLAIPMLAGPASITTAIVLTGESKGLAQFAALIIAILFLSISTWLILRVASRMVESLGPTGINLITRLMGLILAVRAMQLVIDGMLQSFPVLATGLR